MHRRWGRAKRGLNFCLIRLNSFDFAGFAVKRRDFDFIQEVISLSNPMQLEETRLRATDFFDFLLQKIKEKIKGAPKKGPTGAPSKGRPAPRSRAPMQ